jgi:flagellar basal-body rod modification protein FlgD
MADVKSLNNNPVGASDQYVEQIRQKIGTGFSDQKISGKKRNELGKDDFVKLMSAQLKYQDPMSPMKNEQMAAQLAQFSALEQMTNVNQNLEKMTAAQKPQENVLAASLIGKKIATDSSRFEYKKGNQPEVKFELPEDAEHVNVSLVDAKGEVIREIELANMTKGPQAIRWDGKNGKNLDMPNGEYSYRVSASAPGGKPLQISMTTSGLVTGVSFEGGKAMLMVDGRKIPMEAIGRIEADQPAAKAPAAKPLTGEQGGPEAKSSTTPAKEKTTQAAKNSLPAGLTPEKIKSMLGALGGASKMEEEAGPEMSEAQRVPEPLWNPQNL